MTITVQPVDAVSGSPTITGRVMRHMTSATLPAVDGSVFGARGGVRRGTPTDTVTADPTDWFVEPHVGVVDPDWATLAGPYVYAITAQETGSMNAADATNPRWDIISVRIDDPAESDGSSVPVAEVVYTAGTAAASPAVPATPGRSLKLAEIYVAASGGGSPVVSWTAPYLAAAGGFHVIRDTDERDALVTALGPTAENPLLAWRVDADAGFELECTLGGGSTWATIPAQIGRTSYTPTLTGATLGNGTLTGAYTRMGVMVFYEFRLQIGSTTSISSDLQVSVPVEAVLADSIGGTGVTLGIGPNSTEVVTVRGATTTSVYIYLGTTGGNIGSGTSITTGDTVRIVGSYMAA